ncbi:MAG: cyclopropane fatty acyl phospholipid synthase [Chlamydiae bacterium]|nr:cyclopropane fatty acyl phospholipid synthase [Chlamydiota bacterium]
MKKILFLCAVCTLLSLQQSDSKEIIDQLAFSAGIQLNGSDPSDIQVKDNRFYDRVLKDQSLGFGESYMEGWWDVDALDDCMYRIARASLQSRFKKSPSFYWAYLKAKLLNRQDKSKSLDVIRQHYQLGNDLYKAMLDPTMTYSCGYWKNAKTLEEAQLAKYDLIARKLGIKTGMRVLDIGCGWGGFAKFISSKYGAKVTAITLSENQAILAREVCKGLDVEIRVQDYRDLDEKFDRIVEIGMFEHVGVKNYREFMEICYRSLQDGGMVMLHTIGSNESVLNADPWIDRYIFPGGQLPSISQVGKSIEGLFVMEDWHNFGTHYDKTLMAWFKNFDSNWPALKENYSPEFYRMWKFYLLSCAGAFRARDIQLWQVVLVKNGVLGGYETVR